MFKYLKLKNQNKVQGETIRSQQLIIDKLLDEIKRRDQTISTLIQHKEIKNPDPFNFEFPGTEKYFSDFWNNLQKL